LTFKVITGISSAYATGRNWPITLAKRRYLLMAVSLTPQEHYSVTVSMSKCLTWRCGLWAGRHPISDRAVRSHTDDDGVPQFSVQRIPSEVFYRQRTTCSNSIWYVYIDVIRYYWLFTSPGMPCRTALCSADFTFFFHLF